MRIGIFTDTYLPDINGVSTSIMTVESGLKKLGHTPFIFAPNNKLRYESFPEKNTWRLPSVRFYGEKRFRFAVRPLFPKNLHDLPFNIVHTQTPFPIGALGLRLAKKKNLRTVHTYHTRYQEYGHYLKMPKFIINILTKIIMPRIIRFVNKHDAVIAPSSAIKRELESFGVRKPISVIPTGIDVQKTNSLANAKDPRQIMEKYGLTDTSELIISTSRLAKEKNIEFIIRAMPIIIKERPLARLLIIGDGDWKQNLEKLVQEIDMKKHIIFTGFMKHENIFPIYRAGRIFVFSSLTETQGLGALEAMVMGLPVVALKATGIEDLLENNKGGFLIEQKDTDKFAQVVIKLLEDTRLHGLKSEEARRRADDFSIEKTTQALIAVYRGI